MQESKLNSQYTQAALLDQLDLIEYFEPVGHKPYWGEILDKQKKIYEALGVKVPSL